MTGPALIIGLGGTGVLTLTQIKTQLLTQGRGQLPSSVHLLAFDSVQEQELSPGTARESVTGVPLEPGEYYWIGGEVYNYVREIAQGKYPNVSSWFLADVFLETLPRAIFVLQRGAGQLRQFGRLALFRDVSAPSMSTIANAVNRTISNILRAEPVQVLDVFLISSLVGSTGTGLLIDVAHLVRKIAENDYSLPSMVHAFLVLPEAYSVIPRGVTSGMRARAYATMREVQRFAIDAPYESGYPMYYHGRGGEGGIWRSRVKRAVFDSIYYLDGQRSINPLTLTQPEYGVVPAISDAIVAMLNDLSVYHQHRMSVADTALHYAKLPTPHGAIGTYSIVLPMDQIVKLLSCRLALSVLGVIMVSEEREQNLEHRIGRSGQPQAADFLQRAYVQSHTGDERVESTPLLADLFQIAEQDISDHQRAIALLASRRPGEWERLLRPIGVDPRADSLVTEVDRVFALRLVDGTPPRIKGERSVEAVTRITEQVQRFKTYYLGSEDYRTGQRSGGRYRESLEVLSSWQARRFEELLRLETLNILNGGLGSGSQEQKGDILGCLLDFLIELQKILDRFLTVVTDMLEIYGEQVTRRELLDYAMTARRQMERKPGGLFWRGTKQEAYIEAEQRLIDSLKLEIAVGVVRDLVQRLRNHVYILRDTVLEWINALVTSDQSLRSALVKFARTIQSNLEMQCRVRVRKVVDDQEYLEELYHKFAQGYRDGVEDVLSSLEWDHDWSHEGITRQPRLHLTLYSRFDQNTERFDSSLGIQERNLALLLNRCHEVFADVWHDESVLGYLMTQYPDPLTLAEELARNSELPLALIPSSGQPIQALHIHVYSRDVHQDGYLAQVRQRLSAILGCGERWCRLVDSKDPFTLRIVRTLDIVPIYMIASNKQNEAHYLAASKSHEEGERTLLSRSTLHVFPAEVNAARYEDRLPEIGQTIRQLQDEVVLLMEDMPKLRLFLRAWSLGVIDIQQEEIQENGLTLYYYGLALIGYDELLARERKHRLMLTELAEAPSLLSAFATFIYDGVDVRRDFHWAIDYSKVAQFCAKRRDKLGGTHSDVAHLHSFLDRAIAPLIETTNPVIRDLAAIMHLLILDEIRELRALGERGLEFFRVWDGLEELDFGQLARAFCERMAMECDLELTAFTAYYADVYMATFETQRLLKHTPGIVKRLPILLTRFTEGVSESVETIRDIITQVHKAMQRIAILIVPVHAEELEEWRSAVDEKIERVHAIDMIVASREELRLIFSSENPPAALRRLIFSQVNLEAVSPFVPSGPVPDTMFFGRELELRAITEHVGSASYALIGGRRIGKTSILHRLHRVRLPAYGFQSYFHDCSSTPTRTAFLDAVSKAWIGPSEQLPSSFTSIVEHLSKGEPLVFLLDEADKLVPEDAWVLPHRYPLFSELRSLAQSGRCQFVLSGERILRDTIFGDSLGPFHNFAIEQLIGRLEFTDVRELVVRPFKQLEIDLADEEAIVRRVFDITAGHPNVVQRLCHRLIRRLNQLQSRSIDLEDVEAVFSDPDFVRKGFLNTYWAQATVLERLVSLIMAKDETARSLEIVRQNLEQERIQASLNDIDAALERLVDLRNILKRTTSGYGFAVPSFSLLISQPKWLNSYLSRYSEIHKDQGDVIPRELDMPHGG